MAVTARMMQCRALPMCTPPGRVSYFKHLSLHDPLNGKSRPLSQASKQNFVSKRSNGPVVAHPVVANAAFHRSDCLREIHLTSSTWAPFRRSVPVRFATSQAPKSGEHREADGIPPSQPPSTTSQILTRLRPQPHENIYTLPNILTFTRLAAAPLVGYFILTSQPTLALGLFAYAGVTDAVDGYLARRFNSQTVVGTVIDPMADKALMTISVVALAMQGAIPVWVATIILGRDVALAISAIYFRWISLPPPKTMARYWDFSLPSAEVHPTEISKINTFLQILFVGSAMTLPVLPEAFVAAWNMVGVFEGFQYLVAATTIWSGSSYIYSKDAVKILTKEEIEERSSPNEETKKPET